MIVNKALHESELIPAYFGIKALDKERRPNLLTPNRRGSAESAPTSSTPTSPDTWPYIRIPLDQAPQTPEADQSLVAKL